MAISMLQQSSRPESLSSSTPPPPLPYPRSVEDTRSIALLQGRDLSRPSSTSTTQSSFQAPSFRQESIRLPGLAALAQAAERRSYVTPTPTPPPPLAPIPSQNMSYATSAPGQGSVLGSAPPTCQNCSTSTTPLWRRDDSGSVLCNACGLFLKLHNRPRPISLKTDVIKSRNRIKVPSSSSPASVLNTNISGSGTPGDSVSPQEHGVNGIGRPRALPGQSLAAAHPSIASNPLHADRMQQSGYALAYTGTGSREATPNASAVLDGNMAHGNIAPQHLFDSSNLDPSRRNTFSPNLRSENESLRTRVSELEVINDLFRGRVAELEAEVRELRGLSENGGAVKRARDEGDDRQEENGVKGVIEKKRRLSEGHGDDNTNIDGKQMHQAADEAHAESVAATILWRKEPSATT